jgi:chaperone modulatory protein CbpM
MMTNSHTPLSGSIVEEEAEVLTLGELCRRCGVHAELIVTYVEYGMLNPSGQEMTVWRFSAASQRRVARALRLQQDLGINPAGVALALDLLDQIDELYAQLNLLRDR